jgi:hypothetical protein
MFEQKIIRTSVIFLALVAGACSDSPSSTGATGQAQVFLKTDASGSASLLSGENEMTAQDRIQASAIDSVNVTITSVQALLAGRDSANESGWTTVNLVNSGGTRVNLLAFTADSLRIAQGTLAAGTYSHIRLNYDTATSRITLKLPVSVGNSSFVAGTSYPLRISGGSQSGIKIPAASFTVPAGGTGEVTILFDENTSLGTVVATGSGRLQMSSQFKARSH